MATLRIDINHSTHGTTATRHCNARALILFIQLAVGVMGIIAMEEKGDDPAATTFLSVGDCLGGAEIVLGSDSGG